MIFLTFTFLSFRRTCPTIPSSALLLLIRKDPLGSLLGCLVFILLALVFLLGLRNVETGLGALALADTVDPLDEEGEFGNVFETGPLVRVDPAKD